MDLFVSVLELTHSHTIRSAQGGYNIGPFGIDYPVMQHNSGIVPYIAKFSLYLIQMSAYLYNIKGDSQIFQSCIWTINRYEATMT